MSLPDFDPAIHKETGKVSVVRWILGASPRMTCTTGARRVVSAVLQSMAGSNSLHLPLSKEGGD